MLKAVIIPVGALGPMPLYRGWYLYAGSAFGPGGLGARLRRHLQTDKTKHWHIDTLVAHCALVDIWYRCASRDLEHIWAQTLLSHQDTVIPLAGFGASDCRCSSHLVWLCSRKEVKRYPQNPWANFQLVFPSPYNFAQVLPLTGFAWKLMFSPFSLNTITRSLVLVASVFFSPALLADTPTSTLPDTLKLSDGSVLFGKLLSANSGQINFESEHAGSLLIAVKDVQELVSQRVVVFRFTDGQVIRLPKVKMTREPVAITTQDGTMMYALADIDTINPEPWMLGKGHQWTGALIFALELQSGNTDKQEIDFDLNSVWRQSEVRYTLRASGELDEANETTTSDDYTVSAKSDRFLSDTTYAGANLYFEADEFAHLKRRHMLSVYYGKQWQSKPQYRLSTEPGLAFVSESRTDLEKQNYFAFSWNMDMHSTYLGPNTDSYLNQIGVWNMEDTTDIVINTRIGIRMPVRHKITLNTELKLEYDSGAPADVEELDQTFTIGLGYRW